jgi:23S rRNA maturation-related 3'-5' exoribonuclease YhaM
MSLQDKTEIFKKEISYINLSNIKQFVSNALLTIPDYFFEIPASSTGKYHPSYALGTGGLVRHTKAAVGIAYELFRVEMFKYTDEEKDCIIASLILHDTYKSGLNHSTFTVTEHPIIAVEQFSQNDELTSLLSENQKNIIFDCIAHHMGQWTQDYKSKRDVLEKPETKISKFMHLCDYLASRKCLEFNFDV